MRVFAPVQVVLHDLEVRPLVVRRQGGVGFGSALVLAHLHQRLVAHALLRERRIDGPAVPRIRIRKGQPVALVHVVRNGHAFDAGLPQAVEPIPQGFRVWGVAGAERRVRHVGAAEDDVAMHVPHARRQGVLIADEGGEGAGIVVAFGSLRGQPPGPGDGRVLRDLVPFVHQLDEAPAHRVVILDPLRHDRLAHRMAVVRAVRVQQRGMDAEVFGMVRDGQEVERRTRDAHGFAGRQHERRTLGELVGVVRAGAVAAHEGVEGELGVDVQVAEERAALGGFVRVAGDGEEPGGGARGRSEGSHGVSLP